MFSITQSVENNSGTTHRLAPYGMIARHGEPDDLKGFFILHEGVIREVDGELGELDYGDVADMEVDPREGTPAERIEVTRERLDRLHRPLLDDSARARGWPGLHLGRQIRSRCRHLPDRDAPADGRARRRCQHRE